MSNKVNLKFKLTGQTFHEINPEIRISNMNAMAFVSKVRQEMPQKINIEFDGSTEGMMFLSEIAGEIGYYASIEGNAAVFEQV